MTIYIYTHINSYFGRIVCRDIAKLQGWYVFGKYHVFIWFFYHLRRGKNIRLYQQVWSTMVNMIRLFGSISWHINVGIIIGINCMTINMQGKCSMSSFFPTGEDRGQLYGMFPVTGKEYERRQPEMKACPTDHTGSGFGILVSNYPRPYIRKLRFCALNISMIIYVYSVYIYIYTYNYIIILYHIISYYIILYYILLYYIYYIR